MSQKVLVAGTGISGISAAKLLLAQGGEVVLYDGNEKLSEEKLKAKFDEGAKVTIVLGELKKTDLMGVELCVISPGSPLEAPFVAVIDEAKIPIWSEIELAYHCSKGKLAAITGTNGKTTTTALTGEIMRKFYKSVFVVGNIGDPYTAHALETTDESVTVAEVSSFQLETIMDFHPNVSAITNITPDHLDRHKTMECYIQVKEGITRNQTEEDTCVLNYEDPVLREFGKTLKCKVLYFSSKEKLDEGIFMDGDFIVYRHDGKNEKVLDVNELNIIGRHNHENVMTAVAIALEKAGILHSYQLSRILVWKNPEAYPKSGGYQVLQGLYAIGSGGLLGKGLGQSIQKLSFLPEPQNDMIFAVICEELGLFGAVAVIFMFLFMLYRFLVIAGNAPDLFGAMLVTGVLAHIAIQVVLNIAVVTNVIPNTGITLPFISYGGTSVLFLMIEMGMVLSVSNQIRLEQ